MNYLSCRVTSIAALAVMCLSFALPSSITAAEVPNPIPQTIPTGDLIGLEPVADGLTAPNWATFPPGDNQRLFVVDQTGILWVINLASNTKSVFADFSDLLVPLGINGPGSYDERGFLGLAFHPNYQNNGLLYTYTSEPVVGDADFPVPFGAAADHYNVVTEWRVPNPQDLSSVLDDTTRRVVLRIGHPQFNHDGGALNFGQDGMLYISIGDGGGADDQGIGHSTTGNGQDVSNVLGKILRINPRGVSAPNGQYSVPQDNPLVSTEAQSTGGPSGCADGACDEIYAWGFRNPYRFSFDSATGNMYVADVGQNDLEEVHVVVAGGNYGWRVKEGSFCFDPNGVDPGFVTDDDPCPNEPPGLIDPVAEYDHDEGIAIVGGFVYRGSDVPALSGRYIFGDYSRGFTATAGRLFALDTPDIVSDDGTIDTSAISELSVYGRNNLGMRMLGFGEDSRGEVYVLGSTTGVPSGETGVVMRIVSSASVEQRRNYRARLTGDQEVATVPVVTDAIGHALLHLNKDGTRLEVTVMVNNIPDVIGAHIHLAAAGANGPIVASFVPDTEAFLSGGPFISPSIPAQGVFVRGSITEADLLGPLAGQRLEALVDAMRNGTTYVNVHSTEFRPGEIRGQIR